jgi:phytoene/squalene synthetase
MATDLYQAHLDRVSRSFAFCIRQLPQPLRDWVGLSYLLCRVVDTIEDAAWASPEAQFVAFSKFDRALLSIDSILDVSDWLPDFPPSLSESERLLLADAVVLMDDYHRLPEGVHEILCELIYSMSQGMQHFCRGKTEGSLYLRSLAEVNQYCFFVAGVVGELLAKLMARIEPHFALSQTTLLRAHHFGQFLQKVNLLKDQVGDERHGRHLIPSRELVEESSHVNADSALEFLLALPPEQLEFRRFCAWSLFLGLEALRVARRSIDENRIVKVAREVKDDLLYSVEEQLNDERGLRQLYSALVERLGWAASPESASHALEIPAWLLKLYRGPLDRGHLSQLGLVAP